MTDSILQSSNGQVDRGPLNTQNITGKVVDKKKITFTKVVQNLEL